MVDIFVCSLLDEMLVPSVFLEEAGDFQSTGWECLDERASL